MTMEELKVWGVPKFTGQREKTEIPTPGLGEVLIKVVAAGLNPKDWKFTRSLSSSQSFNPGDDISGTIHSAHPSSAFEFPPGTRVAALHRMGTPHGAYAEYAIAPASTTFHLPPNISFEEAAGLPLSVMTAALALYQALGLPLPTTAPGKKDIPLVVYGGATAVGAYAIQLAKLSGLGPIIAVAGGGREFVKSLLRKEDTVVDYRTGNVAGEIIKALKGKKVRHVLDAVSARKSWEVVAEVLKESGGGGEVNMLDLPPDDANWKWPDGIKFSRTFVSSAYYRVHRHISEEQAKVDGDFALFFYRYLAHLLARGDFKPHPHEVLPGGLDGVVEGIQKLYDGKVSAKKLVVRIADTPSLGTCGV